MTSPYFLNVDLEIESKLDLQPLSQELGEKILVLFEGKANEKFCLYFETPGTVSVQTRNQPDSTIIDLCSLIEGLSPEGRRLWNSATRREFDIGYEERLSTDHHNQFMIKPDTIQRISGLNASLSVTLYRENTTTE